MKWVKGAGEEKKNNDIELSCCLTKSLLQLHHNAALFNK